MFNVFTEPVRVTLAGDSEQRMKNYLYDRIMTLKVGLQELHETRLVKWRAAYDATPAQTTRDMPWYGASNLVVPLVGIHSDTLQSRIMAAVFKTTPLWVTKTLGEHGGQAENLREAVEEFLSYVGIEANELDLYRVYHEFTGELTRFGTSTIKAPWESIFEDFVVPAGDGTGRFNYMRRPTFDGPRPEKLPFEDVGVPPAAKTFESADFKYHRRRLQKFELEERRYLGIYEASKVDQILKTPDRTSPTHVQQEQERKTGAKTLSGYGYAEWDVYECWFRYREPNGRMVRILASFHLSSQTLLRTLYNFYPDNLEPFVAARLFFRDDQFYGYGFAETLATLQEELSTIHNQRRDNMTIANTKAWRVDPDSKLHQGYKIFPSAMLPALEGEIEPLQHGEVASQALSVEEERLVMDLAERRSGVSPPQQGYGAGVMHGRRGVYTAMGTLALMQDGNNRTDLNITDVRYAHAKLGRLFLKCYAHFGVGDRAELFGEKAQYIKTALDAVRSNKLMIPVYASNSSVNREVEKQNDLMLVGVMTKHYQMVAQLLQAAAQPMIPNNVREYFGEVVVAADSMMKTVLRHFGIDEPSRLVPKGEMPSPEDLQMAGLQYMLSQGGGGGGQAPPQGGGQVQ